ncbi:O(6)-methylguanine-induced apoptosis 2 [Dromaius novaehollandiae]|uniref:O(6)-methylguanine-induced apoptosis 2 n=1 Tax=Dromaius novaehollandiae TaxID=8790 RepID=UPI00311F1623
MGTCCKSLFSDALGHSERKEGFKVSSGPYKYHSNVVFNSEKKGFNSQSKRFQYNRNETPGPGVYNVTHQSAESNSTSLSQKGTGYFPSLVARIACSKIANYPAANAYRIPSCFQSKQDFSMGNSSMFQQPIARKIEKVPTPAPGQYHVKSIQRYSQALFLKQTSVDFCKQSNNVSAHALFVSKTTRGLNVEKIGKWPSPHNATVVALFDRYKINDSSIKVSPKSVTSCFKSRASHLTKMGRFITEPATYQPHKPTKEAKKTPFRQKFCLTLSAPAIPPSKDPPLPGPGQYDLVDCKGSPKRDCSSAAFVSNTGRWTGRGSQEGFPGPGAYSPRTLEKDSFIYSYDSKWVPVL